MSEFPGVWNLHLSDALIEINDGSGSIPEIDAGSVTDGKN